MWEKILKIFKSDTKKYAIVGAPCSGKTTTINYLKERGHQVVEEVATEVIFEEQAKGGSLFPWVVIDRFQLKILRRLMAAEDKFNEGAVFSDRGIGDGLAYYYNECIKPPKELVDAFKKKRYKKVFFLEPLEYRTDVHRNEGKKKAEKIARRILKTYKDFNYKIVRVPVMSVEERANFILENM